MYIWGATFQLLILVESIVFSGERLLFGCRRFPLSQFCGHLRPVPAALLTQTHSLSLMRVTFVVEEEVSWRFNLMRRPTRPRNAITCPQKPITHTTTKEEKEAEQTSRRKLCGGRGARVSRNNNTSHTHTCKFLPGGAKGSHKKHCTTTTTISNDLMSVVAAAAVAGPNLVFFTSD